ncbi:MAG: hypothetical protein FJY97_19800, partial [candidate division Zixibacteria bacterium]|nr:hypothetical protein [candidate division Zixibacteria bacterium]
ATAKILAAGGGTPLITCHQGTADAERVVREITETGGTASFALYDAANPDVFLETLRNRNVIPTHVYYFPSPKIFLKKGRDWDTDVFRRFVEVYVDGFAHLYRICSLVQPDRLVMFYPSTTALDKAVVYLAEYTAAKGAGEALCRYLTGLDPRLSIRIERLPRMTPDQTLTLMPIAAKDPLPVMLDIIRDLHTISP